ncbi:MAG: ribonuclease HII [Acidobacteriaceae bacterium]
MPFSPSIAASYPVVTGCDEVGRGALCGPVVVAAVWFEPSAIPARLLEELDDSKRLSAKKRERLAAELRCVARVAVAASSAACIDKRGIRTMTLDAMRRAVLRLSILAPVYVDGVDVPPGIPLPCTAIVKGDATVPQIAAASIVAKVLRDKLLTQLALLHPAYGWEKNAGYGTPQHLAALAQYGPTRHHRRSFAPVSGMLATTARPAIKR